MPHVRAEPGTLLHGLVSTLFPARCVGCGRRGAALCAECRGRLPLLPAEICGRCALPRNGIGPCRACARLSPSLASVRAVCAYEGTARAAVHTLKFRGGRYLAPVMGELLRERLSVWPLHVDVVVPTPLGPGRMRERGYNQAALLAREVVEAAGAAFAESALSREDRHPQQSLTAGQRRRNLVGAVTCVDPGPVVGRRLLVVDDVMTTGTTLAACADALTAAGAVWVGALVFARDL